MTINLTDPANHPANPPLTGERIERVIEALESSLKYRNGSNMDHFIADAVKGLRELRVSRKGDEPTDDERIMVIEGIAQPSLVVPNGYVLVPIEPTRQMMSQGHFAMGGTDRGKFRRIWQAMLAVAPKEVG